jgi:hypothetical protein
MNCRCRTAEAAEAAESSTRRAGISLTSRFVAVGSKAHHGHVIRAAIGRQAAEYSHFLVRAGLKRDCFSVREIDEDLKTLGG